MYNIKSITVEEITNQELDLITRNFNDGLGISIERNDTCAYNNAKNAIINDRLDYIQLEAQYDDMNKEYVIYSFYRKNKAIKIIMNISNDGFNTEDILGGYIAPKVSLLDYTQPPEQIIDQLQFMVL